MAKETKETEFDPVAEIRKWITDPIIQGIESLGESVTGLERRTTETSEIMQKAGVQITKSISPSGGEDEPIDPISGRHLDWAEMQERDKDRERMRVLKSQQGDGVFRRDGDSIRRRFIPGLGWIKELRRGDSGQGLPKEVRMVRDENGLWRRQRYGR